ncbi:MAG: cell division protein FtsZ [Elusimicrobiota bacterium]|jgi:cell division protein FtsZ|nr:cell division protein FtsZ [Elusimicrobiota bacterium]
MIGLFNKETTDQEQPTVIKVVGVGGCGNNAINRMIAENISDVEFIGVNTDLQVLRKCRGVTIEIGETISGGKGVGGDPELGKQAAEENIDRLKEVITGTDMLIVTAGMGGGTGTGAAPVVAQIAKELKCLTIAIVTTPFKWEGRDDIAKEGLEKLRQCTDALIEVSNAKAIKIEGLSMESMYTVVDDVLRRSVQTITEVITQTGEINRDFNDVKTVLKDSGDAVIGWGECGAEENWMEAFNGAVHNELVESFDISKAKKILVNLTTPHNVPAAKIDEILAIFEKSVPGGTNVKGRVFFGQQYKDRLDNKVSVAVIASGFKTNERIGKRSQAPQEIKDQKDHKNIKRNPQQKEKSPTAQPQLPLQKTKSEIAFDVPAFEGHWQPSGRLDKR